MKEYFDDAKLWYYTKYIQSIRFVCITFGISCVVVFVVFFATNGAYKAVTGMEAVTKVIHTSYDTSLFPKINKIEHYYHSNDLNILHYTDKTFVGSFETYERSDNQHLVFVEKMKYIQSYSSASVIKVMQDKFNKEYSKILENGGFVRANVQDIYFGVDNKTAMEKLYTFLMPEPIPQNVIVTVQLYTFDGKKLTKKIVEIKLNIKFQKIQKQKDGHYNTIKFFVNDYQYL
jgi:hypothetical protein